VADDDALLAELAAACTGAVRGDVSLAGHTTLRVGGPARVLVEAEEDGDLAAVGRAARTHDVRVLVLGRGSNMLVTDAGWPGIALVLGRGLRGIELAAPHGGRRRLHVGGAEPLPVVAVATADAGLGGFAWGAGVPGTVGGAVRMNAGAHGEEMVDALVEAELFRLEAGVREVWPADQLGLRYRGSSLPSDAVVVAATLELPVAGAEQVRAEIAEVRRWRRAHQPINRPNCGSVFVNPQGDSAGRLIDDAGLRGLRHGGARVSEMHANFIVTEPGATAADVLAVIDEVRATVLARHGVELRSELVVVGQR
jgi:UDP-N-acetylmuramate dehydrogenase